MATKKTNKAVAKVDRSKVKAKKLVMSKLDLKSTAALLLSAAHVIRRDADTKTGSHMTVGEALGKARAEDKMRRDVLIRAYDLFTKHFGEDMGTPKTGAKKGVELFGKCYSMSMNKYAIESVKKNMEGRIDALLFCSKVAEAHPSKW